MKKYIEPEIMKKINGIDLLTWLMTTDPGRVKVCSHNTYCLTDHDSLKISNGKWFWWSKGIGGGNAISFLMKVEGKELLEAANEIMLSMDIDDTTLLRNSDVKTFAKSSEPKIFKKPMIRYQPKEAIDYLRSRGIAESVISFFVKEKLVSETYDKNFIVFFGRDEKGEYKYGSMRSIIPGKNDKRECSGSNKEYSFRYYTPLHKDTLHVFEAAIDMLSYASLLPENAFLGLNLLSLGGVHQQSDLRKLPPALQNCIISKPHIKKVYLHLDSDEAGTIATNQLMISLQKLGMEVIDNRPSGAKDINEYLVSSIKKQKERAVEI